MSISNDVPPLGGVKQGRGE